MVHVKTENNILAREYASRQINKILEFQVPTYNLLLVLFECFHLIFKWHGGTMDFVSMQGWGQRENLERGCLLNMSWRNNELLWLLWFCCCCCWWWMDFFCMQGWGQRQRKSWEGLLAKYELKEQWERVGWGQADRLLDNGCTERWWGIVEGHICSCYSTISTTCGGAYMPLL